MKLAITACKGAIKNTTILKETITVDDYNDAYKMVINSDYCYGGETSDGKHKVWKTHIVEPTAENKMAIRNQYNANNPAYAVCIACGKDLHEHNKESHFQSKFGILGSECYKKLMFAI